MDSKSQGPIGYSEAEQAHEPEQQQGQSSALWLALLGLGVVTLILGGLAFWYAGSVRQMEAAVTQERVARATLQARADAEAVRADAAQIAAQASATQAAEAQTTSAVYSRIVRANQLANNALLALATRPQAALLLAIESIRVQRESNEAPLPEAVQRLRSLLGATGGIPLSTSQEATTALAVSQDARWVAAGDEAGTIRLWDLQDVTAPPFLLQGHSGPVWDLVFVPQDDAFYSAGDDGSLRRWPLPGAADALSAGLLQQAQAEPIYVLALSPDGRRLASGSADGTVRLWRIEQPQVSPLVLRGHSADVNTLAFSPDGKLLASAGNDSDIRLWDSQTGELRARLVAHSGFVNLVVFSPDGAWLASGGSNGQVHLWPVTELAAQNEAEPGAGSTTLRSIPLLGHELAVYALRFSPDSSRLASADDNGAVRLWDLTQPEESLLLGRHQGNVRGLAFVQGESGPALVSAGYDGQVRLWDYSNPDAVENIVRGHDAAINLLASPASSASAVLTKLIVTAGYDHSLRVWRTDSPFSEPEQVLPAGAAVADVAVAPDGAQLASYMADSPTIQLWDVQSGAPGLRLTGGAAVSALTYSGRGQTLWAGGRDGSVSLWDTQSGDLLRQFRAGDNAVTALAISPDGAILAGGSEDGLIYLWDNAATLLYTLSGHTGAVTGLAFAPDGKMLTSAGLGAGTLRLWDAATGQERQVLQGPELGLLDVAIQPQGPWLVGAGGDGAVWVWNADALAFEPAQLRRHRNEVNAVNFSADGLVLASAGADAAVYLWSTANPSAEPYALVGHRSSVNGVTFAPDGAWVATASADGTIRRWSLSLDKLLAEACRTAGRNFTLEEWTQYFPTGVSRYRKTCPDLPGP